VAVDVAPPAAEQRATADIQAPVRNVQAAPRAVLVTNIPAPYRVPVFNLLVGMPQLEFTVIFCAEREPDRSWDYPALTCAHVFLRQRMVARHGRWVHINPDVLGHLRRLTPDVVITTGLNPTHLLAFAYTMATRAAHIHMTDGTATSEQMRGWKHRLLRTWVFRNSRAFIGASNGSVALYRGYGIAEGAIFRSPLAVDNARFGCAATGQRDFDLMFCGQLIERKLPKFALDVAQRTGALCGRTVRMLVVGTGPLQEELVRYSSAERTSPGVEVVFFGHASQAELPALYARAKVLLFPTTQDPWGVVANEASAACLPVIVSPFAGVAHELVVDGVNGHVLPLAAGLWAEAAAGLLSDERKWMRFSRAASEQAARFTYEIAARGIAEAVSFAASSDRPR